LGISDKISKMLNSTAFLSMVKDIEAEATQDLRDAVLKYHYQAYNPKEYERTFQFLNSIRSELVVSGFSIEMRIFFDENLMSHKSVIDEEGTYVPPLLYFGHTQFGYEGTNDYFHDYPGDRRWLDETAEKIKQKVNIKFKRAVTTIITNKNYR